MQLDCVDNPFLNMLGASLQSWRPDLAVFQLDINAGHLNRQGTLQGGVISTLLDAACGYSGLYTEPDDVPRHASTLSLTINFVSKVEFGIVTARGTRTGGGRKIFFASGELHSESGELIANAVGTFKYSRPDIPDHSHAKGRG